MELTSKRKLAIVTFALNLLASNIDDLKADEDVLAGGGETLTLHPLPTSEEIHALREQLQNDAKPADELLVSYVLRDDELEFEQGDTLKDVLVAGSRLIDDCMEPPVSVFQLADDRRWFVASIECHVDEANPAMVREMIDERIEFLEDSEDVDTEELAYLRAELAKLPASSALPYLPPETDPNHHTFQFSETGYDPERDGDANDDRL